MRHDVAVVGAGPVGLTAALALARGGLRVAVVEARPEPPPGDAAAPFDARVSALTPVSWRVLGRLGVTARLPAERLGPFHAMHVWDRAGFGEVHFDAAQAGLPGLGVVVENDRLTAALAGAARERSSIRWYRPARVEALERLPSAVGVLTDGPRFEARLVVAADGAGSRVRTLAGIPAHVRPYDQQALVATVRTARGTGSTAWQRFLPRGPLAFLPLPERWASIVWSSAAEHAAALEAMPEAAFREVLADAIEHRLGDVEAVHGRSSFPLARVVAERYLAPRVALVGDAAHTIHPLAGQGVNLGILDAAVLADVVLDATAAERDPGRVHNLRRYERARRAHNTIVGDAMTLFHRAFTSPLAPVALLRNLGFAVTDRLDPLKRLFITYASGLAGDLPSLARDPIPAEGRAGCIRDSTHA